MEENKVKGFVKKHKKTFIVSGIILTGVISGILFKKSIAISLNPKTKSLDFWSTQSK